MSISLWFDHWIDRDFISSKFPTIHFSSMDWVIDIIHENSWTIPPQLPPHLKDYLLQSTRDILIADDSSLESLSWIVSSSGNLSLKVAWHLLRTRAIGLPLTDLILNKYVDPQLASFSWHLLHRKTPTDLVAKYRGCIIASRCYICHLCEETNIHLFFSEVWQTTSGLGFPVPVDIPLLLLPRLLLFG